MFDVGSSRLIRRMQLDERSGKLRSAEWLNAVGRSLREAEIGRGVGAQLDDRCGQLRSVESLNAAGRLLRIAEVGRVW